MRGALSRRLTGRFFLTLCALSVPLTAYADAKHHASGGHHGLTAEVWLVLALILLAAKAGGELAERIGQPPVLGELAAGIFLGNLNLVGVHALDTVPEMSAVILLAELGVALLLFEVGLESTLLEMRKVAPQSGLVAVIGVVTPMFLGYWASAWLVPEAHFAMHLFTGATLAATSVGITARVLKDIDAMDCPEARVILGAAVIDDVLGLIVLAVVVSIASVGHVPSVGSFGVILGLATGFLVGALLLGAFVMPGIFKAASKLRTQGVLGALAIALCMLLAGAASAAGLAAIVGAFAAGLILDEVHVRPFGKHSAHDLNEHVSPIVAVLAPIFFVRTGMMVDLGSANTEAVTLTIALTAVAVVGKLVAGFGVRGETDRWSVGIGMIPRGEVGLIFADQGARIMVDGHPLIEPAVYTAIVLMVMASTIITPPWLAVRLRKILAARAAQSADPAATAE
ncbi:MAG: cation:proton antiporter [Myxococcales bacterium]|nr:cation:proton antiporter [Myxococcales bacterium]